MKLICASPDVRPGMAAVLAGLQRASVLEAFVTPLAWQVGGLLDKSAFALPVVGRKLRRLLANRSLPADLTGVAVHTYPGHETVRLLGARLTSDAIRADKLWWRAERSFDNYVARRWAGRAPFLYGFEAASAVSFQQQKRAGGWTILNQLIGHHATIHHHLEQEFACYPDAITAYDRHLMKSAPRLNALKDQQIADSDLIIANSEFVKQTFVEAGVEAGKIIVIAGAGPTLPQVPPPSLDTAGPVVFLNAGSQSIRKGIPYLLEAWRGLDTRAGAELWLIGKNTLPPRLFENLPGTVAIRPPMPRQELFATYQKASVLVLPSLCEGFALVILEAMAHGLPVITTPNSGCGNFVEDGVNGWVIPARDVARLTEKMHWCLENPAALREMGRVSQRKAAAWTWDTYTQVHAETVLAFMRGKIGAIASEDQECAFA